jgi:hypothetical protein
MMKDMGQQHWTAHPSDSSAGNATDNATDNAIDNAIDLMSDLPVMGDDDWEQAQLPITTERRRQQLRDAAPRGYAGKPTERLREVGLVGIARARAALAEAARRADQAREAQQATKAA